MLILDSTSAVVRQVPTTHVRRVPETDWTPTPAFDRTPGDVAAAIEVLRYANDHEGTLTDAESRALDLLYRRYATLVTRVAATFTHNAADAEDIAQDVFVGLPRALRSYRPGNFEGWLRTVTARTALMRIRRRARERDVQTSIALTVEEGHAGDGDTLVDSDRVRRAVERLPASLRNVVELRLLGGLPHGEIARRLGVTPNACEVRLCRAIKQLRALVGEAA